MCNVYASIYFLLFSLIHDTFCRNSLPFIDMDSRFKKLMQYAGLQQIVFSRKKINKLQQTVEKLDGELGKFGLVEELKTKKMPTPQTRSGSPPTSPPPPPPLIESSDKAISFEGQSLPDADNPENSLIPQTRSESAPTPPPPPRPIESSYNGVSFDGQPLSAEKLEQDLLPQIQAGITLNCVEDKKLDEPKTNQINESSLESALQVAMDRIG